MPSCDRIKYSNGPVQLVAPCTRTEQRLVHMHGGRGLQGLRVLGKQVDDPLGVVV